MKRLRSRSRESRVERHRTRRQRRRAWPEELTWEDRLSDRLNPVFVRDLQQAMHGKLVRAAIAGVGSLLAVRVFSLMSHEQTVYIGATSDPVFAANVQRMLADLWGMLLAVVVLVVPLRAFLSMRDEVLPAATEQLALSDLDPNAVFRAKLLSSLVLLTVFVGMFAPLFALMCALRAVGVGEVVAVLWVTLLVSVACTCVALSSATLCSRASVRNLMLGLVAAGLTGIGLLLYASQAEFWSAVEFSSRNTPLALWIGTAIPAVVLVVFCAIACSTAFAHDHENRATRIRLVVLLALVAMLIVGWLVDLRGTAVGIWCVLATAPFCLAAVTDRAGMSRIVRAQLPSGPGLQRLLAPLLPGRGRGMVFSILALAVADLVGFALVGGAGAAPIHLCAMYAIVFTGAALLVRNRSSAIVARVSVAGACLAATLLPLCFNAARGVPLGAWTPLEVVSPIATVQRAWAEGARTQDVVTLAVLTVVILMLTSPAMIRGLRDLGPALDPEAAS